MSQFWDSIVFTKLVQRIFNHDKIRDGCFTAGNVLNILIL